MKLFCHCCLSIDCMCTLWHNAWLFTWCGIKLFQAWQCHNHLTPIVRAINLIVHDNNRGLLIRNIVDRIVLQIQTFELWQLLQLLEILPVLQVVIAEPELFQTTHALDVIDALNQIIGQIQHFQACQALKTINARQTIVTDVELFQIHQVAQIL